MAQGFDACRLRRGAAVWFALAAWAAIGLAAPVSRADESEKSWRELREALFGGQPIGDGGAMLKLDAPARADDPALIPVEITDPHEAHLHIGRRLSSSAKGAR